MAKKKNHQGEGGGTVKRDILYNEAAKHAPRAIEIVVDLMEHGDNDNVKLGAAKTILAKAIPDLQAMEVRGDAEVKYLISLNVQNTKARFLEPHEVSTETD